MENKLFSIYIYYGEQIIVHLYLRCGTNYCPFIFNSGNKLFFINIYYGEEIIVHLYLIWQTNYCSSTFIMGNKLMSSIPNMENRILTSIINMEKKLLPIYIWCGEQIIDYLYLIGGTNYSSLIFIMGNKLLSTYI